MNPSENKGPGFGQPANNNADLPAVHASQVPAVPGQASPASGHPTQGSVLDVTLRQLTQLTHQYSQDPYMQAKEIERLKTAYLSKEFGRTLKAVDNP